MGGGVPARLTSTSCEPFQESGKNCKGMNNQLDDKLVMLNRLAFVFHSWQQSMKVTRAEC